MGWHKIFGIFFVFLTSIYVVQGSVEGLYCGADNCYEILGVTRDSTRGEIVKAYRGLARKWHPDVHKTEKKKEEASKKFQEIANAYEILKDEDSRNDYDYMLDHPDEFYYNYYRYYKTHTAPKVDVRIVIAVTITVISIVQYYGAWSNYQTAIKYLCSEEKYRHQASNIAKERRLLPVNKKTEAGRRTKEEIKEEEEAILKSIIEENMDIRGGYSKPTFYDILWVQMVLLPYYTVLYVKWYARWIWKFTICKHELGDTEKLYLIRKYLKLSQHQFDALEDYEREEYMHLELWIKDNFTAWKAKKEAELMSKRADSGRYKSYRRYMKKGGPGQMVFGPD